MTDAEKVGMSESCEHEDFVAEVTVDRVWMDLPKQGKPDREYER